MALSTTVEKLKAEVEAASGAVQSCLRVGLATTEDLTRCNLRLRKAVADLDQYWEARANSEAALALAGQQLIALAAKSIQS